MGYDLNCTTSWSNVGGKTCKEDMGWDEKLILAPSGVTIDTEANAKLLATWTTMINADWATRVLPLGLAFDIEVESGETVYQEGADGKLLQSAEGKRSMRQFINLPLCVHQAYRTHNTRDLKAWIVTSKGYIKGTTSDDTKFEPQSLNLFEVEKQTSAEKGDKAPMTPVRVIFNDATEWDDRGVFIKPTAFNPLTQLNGLQDVTIACTSPTVAGCILTVLTTCDLVGVDGLVKEDLSLADDAGGVETITTLTGLGNGVYTLVATLIADSYVLTMDDPADAVTKGYEATSTATFTVS
jgi:hypothetical protein